MTAFQSMKQGWHSPAASLSHLGGSQQWGSRDFDSPMAAAMAASVAGMPLHEPHDEAQKITEACSSS